jgi:oligopeptide transport system substrate-binding protein
MRPIVYLSLILLFVSLSCGLPAVGGQNPGAAYGIAREEAIFLTAGQPRTLDPAVTYGGPADVVGAIFNGLVTLDAELQVQPDLAAGWEISDDGRIYTFYLTRQAMFHDGRPLTAHDVIYSWERALDPATGSETAVTYLGDIQGAIERHDGRAAHISGLRAVDDHTLEVTLIAPISYFLAKLTYPVAFVVDKENVTQANWERRPNGAGPFKLRLWRDDEIIILDRFERYHDQPAHMKHLVYLMGAGIPLSLYETDQIDLVGISGGSLERAQDPNSPLAADLRVGVNYCTTMIGLNSRIPPFDDARVRQAFNYALDQERLMTALYRGAALPAYAVLPPGMPGYQPREARYAYDLAQARALLAEAGYNDPADLPPLTYSASGYGDVSGFVTAVITLWQEGLGATIEPVLHDPYLYLDELYAGNVGNFFGFGWCADYPDPENFLDILFHSQSRQNIGGFASPALDAALEQARVEPDTAARMALYAELEDALIEQAPAVFVSHSLSAVLVKPHLEGYTHTPIGVAQWRRVSRK